MTDPMTASEAEHDAAAHLSLLLHEEVLFGMRYTELVSFDTEGHPVADLSAVSRAERDVGPEPPHTGWEDRTWKEA